MSTPRKAPPSRLGRGLSALIPDGPAPTAEQAALRTLPVEALEPGPFQPRGGMDKASLDDLAASIREHGILQPILARPKPGADGTYEIIGGERRWRAAQAAQLHEVPVVIRDLGQDDSADLRRVLRDPSVDQAGLRDAILEAIGRKPKGHDFVIDRRRKAPAVARHMSVTGG